MVGLLELWLPILVSAVAVWIASAIIWMALPWHKSDVKKLDREEAVLDALGKVPTGQYVVPHVEDWQNVPAEVNERLERSSPAFVTIMEWPPKMGRQLTIWLLHLIVVSIFVAYVTGRALEAGAGFLEVWQIAGSVAIIAHGAGTFVESIFWGRPWSTTFRNAIDAIIYGLLTGAVFGWLWP